MANSLRLAGVLLCILLAGAECPEYNTCFYTDGDSDGYVSWVGEHLVDFPHYDHEGQAVNCPEHTAKGGTDVLDCDDDDWAVSPELPEACGDGLDNDCDGAIDDADPGGCE